MKIKELLEDLSVKGNTIAKIAKEKVGIGEKRLKEVLHNAGYEYRNSGQKGWFYSKEGEEPLYQSVFEFIETKNNSPRVKRNSHEHLPDVKQTSPIDPQPIALDVNPIRNEGEKIVHTDFTPEERMVLRELIKAYVLDEKTDHQGNIDDLYKRVVTLEKGTKVRKTIVINGEVGELLDKFSEDQKINKSDILELAILDLINKYK
ncbi:MULTISPECIES: hypothetical protein [Bacteria]|uniref:hypothetical protein n=1 Tax=Bacteria TaxID=2 RepID=UPI0007D8678B